MRIHNLLSHYSHDDQPAARSALGHVIDACFDGQLGYAKARTLVDDPGLVALFDAMSRERGEFGRILQEHSLWLGGAPDAGPGVGGKLHREWMQLRGQIEHGAATAVVAECERGEHAAITRYEHALSVPMPEDLRQILLTQITQVRHTHDRLDRMLGRTSSTLRNA